MSTKRTTRRQFLRAAGGTAVSAFAGGALTRRWFQTQTAVPNEPQIKGVQVPPITTTTASGLTIHAIQTGFVAVKDVHREYGGRGNGLLAIVAARNWTEWLPIYTWVIEHPEGVILIDTGETNRVYEPDYFSCDPVTQFVHTQQLKYAVTPQDEIGPQLRSLGIDPQKDVRWVIQTHIHTDHMGGLPYFENSEVIMRQTEFSNPATVRCRLPNWLSPTLLEDDNTPFETFAQSHVLTNAQDVVLVSTPGHTDGHQSVLLLDGNQTYCFAGDVAFSETQLLNEGVAGIVVSRDASLATLQAIRAYATRTPTIFLPSHDPESGSRLATAQAMPL